MDYPPLECNYGWPIAVFLIAIQLMKFTMLSLAAAFVSLTVTKSKFFTSFRDFFFNLSGNLKTPFQKVMGWVYDLVTCPYCFSHWVCIAVVAVYRPNFINSGYLLADLAVSTFAMIGLTSYLWVGFYYLSNRSEP